MTIKIQIIIGIVVLSALVLIVNMIRKNKLDLRYGLGWVVVLMAVLILDIFPQLTTWLSVLMGVELPINMLFFLGFCFSLVLIFGLTVSVSRMAQKVKKLTQELALYEEKLRQMEEK